MIVSSTTAGSPNVLHAMTSTTDMAACFAWAHNNDAHRRTVHFVLNPDDSASPLASETVTVQLAPYESAWIINGLRFRKSTSASNTYTIAVYAAAADANTAVVGFYANRQYQDQVTA